jgi:hypothetical protein
MPAPASSLIHAVCAQLATLQVPDPAALPGLLDVLAGVADPRARRGVRHRLVTILAVSICVTLLVRGNYPQGIFDAVLGMDRWAIRVAAYAALMTDAYPPFRLDQGGSEPLPTPRPDSPLASDTSGTTTQAPPLPVPG